MAHAHFTVRAVRMARLGGRSDERSDVQLLASEAAESFGAAAEIARSYAVRYGYPEELLLSQMEWAEECCTGQGPPGSAQHVTPRASRPNDLETTVRCHYRRRQTSSSQPESRLWYYDAPTRMR